LGKAVYFRVNDYFQIMSKSAFREILFFTLILPFASCFLWQQNSEQATATGTIQVIGNHPFEKLALFKEDGTVLVINASKKNFNEMMAVQGSKVILWYTDLQHSDEMDEVNVTSFKIISQTQ